MYENNLLAGETLCKECGLCCQGVFHTFAYLYTEDDIKIVQKENINIHLNNENCKTFKLPCSVFDNLCSIYPERPSVCGKHKCNLLTSVIKEEIALNDAIKITEKIKYLLKKLLPELKALSKNDEINCSPALITIIFNNLEDGVSSEKFKEENKKLLMNLGVFNFLQEKYFYKNKNTQLSE